MFAEPENCEITFIKETVKAQFDNIQQTPLGFQWQGKNFEVLKLLHVSKNQEGQLQYLLLTDGGVFNLVLQREQKNAALCRSKWVLSYKL